jgi:hybrid cluster-associated redox disulfide protein
MDNQGQRQNQAVPPHDTLAQLIIEDVLTEWPQTAVVFQRHNMACVGCAVASFYSIADAADIYGLPLPQFLAELTSVMAAP